MPIATIDAYRIQLEEERKELLHKLEHIQERTARKGKAEQGGSETPHDDHMAESAAIHYEREKDLLSESNVKRLLQQVDAALGKMAAGSYGVCDMCGEAIAEERLQALPSAALCIECQTLAES